MSEPKNRFRPDYSKYDAMSTEELELILRQDFQRPAEQSDPDAILYIAEVIKQRNSEQAPESRPDVDAAWQSFLENYYPEADAFTDEEDAPDDGIRLHSATPLPEHSKPQKNGRKRRRLIRSAQIAAIFALIILTSSVTASAFGFNLWHAVAQWANETFYFESEEDSKQTTEFSSLLDALEEYGITDAVAPTWMPDGYVLTDVSVLETPTQIKFTGSYFNSTDELIIQIYCYQDDTVPSITYEKNENVTVYQINNIDHYIMTNMSNDNNTQAIWTSGNNECLISGNLSESEMKIIINSIYER